jgi:hypothetical protein
VAYLGETPWYTGEGGGKFTNFHGKNGLNPKPLSALTLNCPSSPSFSPALPCPACPPPMDDLVSDTNAFVEHVQSESILKERTLARIQSAIKRERSDSILTSKSKAESVADDHLSLEQPPTDVREELFDAIPEPFYQITDFQRVIITETQDDFSDPDTKAACDGLKTCMNLRDKWISEHPFPPQDLSGFESEAPTPISGGTSPVRRASERKDPHEFRRRANRPYSIFDQQLPQFDHTDRYKYKLFRGVMSVIRINKPDSENDDGTDNEKSEVEDWTKTVHSVRTFDEFVADFQKVYFPFISISVCLNFVCV